MMTLCIRNGTLHASRGTVAYYWTKCSHTFSSFAAVRVLHGVSAKKKGENKRARLVGRPHAPRMERLRDHDKAFPPRSGRCPPCATPCSNPVPLEGNLTKTVTPRSENHFPSATSDPFVFCTNGLGEKWAHNTPILTKALSRNFFSLSACVNPSGGMRSQVERVMDGTSGVEGGKEGRKKHTLWGNNSTVTLWADHADQDRVK